MDSVFKTSNSSSASAQKNLMEVELDLSRSDKIRAEFRSVQTNMDKKVWYYIQNVYRTEIEGHALA